MRSKLRRPSHATVVAYVALFVALGGTGYAAATIGANDIKDDAVRTRHIKNGAVSLPKLAGAAQWKLRKIIVGQITNGGFEGEFATGGGDALIYLAGSGFRRQDEGPGKVTVTACVDLTVGRGDFHCNARMSSEVYASDPLKHLATIPAWKRAPLRSGNHTVSVFTDNGTMDDKDHVQLMVLELPH